MKTTKNRLNAVLDAFDRAGQRVDGVKIKEAKNEEWSIDISAKTLSSNDAIKFARKITDGARFCNFLNSLHIEVVSGDDKKPIDKDELAVWIETSQYEDLMDFLERR